LRPCGWTPVGQTINAFFKVVDNLSDSTPLVAVLALDNAIDVIVRKLHSSAFTEALPMDAFVGATVPLEDLTANFKATIVPDFAAP
jgi:hypothetical protein